MRPRRLRLGLVTPRYPPALGGVERHVEVLATGAAAAGLSVEVVTTDATGQLPATDVLQGVRLRRFGTLPGGDVFYLSPRLAWWLLLHARRYDLVHAHSYHAPVALIAAVAAALHGVPFVVTPHYHGGGHTRARQVVHKVYRAFGAWAVRRAALVICNSESECAIVRSDFGESLPTRVILPGVEVESIRSAEPFEGLERIVLTGGRIEEYKQVDRVVRAMADVPDYRLVIFGDGPALPAIRSAIADSGVSDRVDVLGRVDDRELQRWFRTADVFVSLSRKEAFGLTVVEAAAAGASVVISDIPAYREMAVRLGPRMARVVAVDAEPPTVATAIVAAAAGRRGTPPQPAAPLPTWDAMSAAVVSAYADVVEQARARRPGDAT